MRRHTHARSKMLLSLVMVSGLASLVTGCAPAADAPVDEAAVPQAIQDSGVLRIGTTPIIGLPWTAVDEATDTNTGIDPELGTAIAEQLGLKAEFVNLGFDSLIPSLEAERIDLIMSDMLDTPERQNAVDFVDYVLGGDGLMTQADSPHSPANLDELCGLRVGVLRGAAAHLTIGDVECPADAQIDIQVYPDTNAELAALDSNRIDVASGDPSIWGYLAKQEPDRYRVTGESFNLGPLGIGVSKGSSLAPAVAEALNALIEDGTYGEILEKYSLPKDVYLTEAGINQGQ